MTEEQKNVMKYYIALDVLRQLLAGGGFERCVLERINIKNAEKMHCMVVPL